LRFVQPAFVVWNDSGSPNNPNAWLTLFDQHLSTSELLAQRDLSIGSDDLDGWMRHGCIHDFVHL